MLYGLTRLVRFCLRGGGWGGRQSIYESEFPPSVACRRHLPPRGTAFSGSCFAVAGVGALVVGQSWFESESPLSVPLGHLSPKGIGFWVVLFECLAYNRHKESTHSIVWMPHR